MNGEDWISVAAQIVGSAASSSGSPGARGPQQPPSASVAAKDVVKTFLKSPSTFRNLDIRYEACTFNQIAVVFSSSSCERLDARIRRVSGWIARCVGSCFQP